MSYDRALVEPTVKARVYVGRILKGALQLQMEIGKIGQVIELISS
jgi:hypothetical protein